MRGIVLHDRLHNFTESCAALRRMLSGGGSGLRGDDAPPPAPSFAWCTPRRLLTREVLDEELGQLDVGHAVAVRLADGRVLVGRVVHRGAGFVVLHLFGRSTPTRVAHSSVTTLAHLTGHTWTERHAVAQRQATGEPALTLPSVAPPLAKPVRRCRGCGDALHHRRRSRFCSLDCAAATHARSDHSADTTGTPESESAPAGR